jgi:hypothetical protein
MIEKAAKGELKCGMLKVLLHELFNPNWFFPIKPSGLLINQNIPIFGFKFAEIFKFDVI